ncbi:hypothetical protein [Legionella waltersii]|uniref:Uncharacterized protein n=2 Tax=Legionella waltersii TaxID=66969 RepID=A0A0W1A4T6_9GAMM|nr:hypothetical protein [Legionella waltersii]KTD76351.1 hypothetical protein Lwal_2073 [Legionella waltersii]SNV13894.1 Uncharacterised protein [Legionella waltersii]
MFSKYNTPRPDTSAVVGVVSCVAALATVLLLKAMSSEEVKFEPYLILNGTLDFYPSNDDYDIQSDDEDETPFQFQF